MTFPIVFVLHGERHEDPGHSELSALAARHGLTLASGTEATGLLIDITDLGFRADDEYHPYRAAFRSAPDAARFLVAELPFHEGISILSHPDRFDPAKDALLVDDDGLAAEMRAAGMNVTAVDPARPDLLVPALSAGSLADIDRDIDAEMFAGGDPGERSVGHVIPQHLRMPDAAPFPVVLGRGALVAGLSATGGPLPAQEVIDRLIAIMGGEGAELTVTDDGVTAAVHEGPGHAMELMVVPTFAADGLAHPGPFVEMRQYFDSVDDMNAEIPVEETVDAGVQRVAREIGLCLAVEIPFDAAAGVLRGWRRGPNGGLIPVRLFHDAEAEDG